MKKVGILVLGMVMALVLVTGCSQGAPAGGDKPAAGETAGTEPASKPEAPAMEPEATPASAPEGVTVEEKDGLTIYTDLQKSPFENSGLKITIKKGEDGYAKFVKTDLTGKETVDYYNFDYAKNVMEKYYYVSAMGTAYYYYYDLAGNALVKVEDGDHKDSTQSLKDNKRWDGANEKTQDEVKSLEDYFKSQYGMTIKEAVAGK